MDRKIYKYDVRVSRGYFDPTIWDFIDNEESWCPDDFIKPNRQGKQTPIIVDPQKDTESVLKHKTY